MNQEPMKLRWLIAHQPAHLFIRTAEAFAAELEKELPGQYEIEILTMRKYMEKYGDIPELKMKPGTVEGVEKLEGQEFFESVEWDKIKEKWQAFFNALKTAKIHLSQTQVTTIGYLHSLYNVLDLPFLFKDHDHVSRVLDGSIGDKLSQGLKDKTGVRGLAFTYSGGYRIIGSNHPIKNLDELKNVEVTTVPYTKELFAKLAKNAINRQSQKLDEIAENVSSGGAIETTYLRFAGKNVLKTNHSIFMTSILIGEPFFETLPEEHREVFQRAAKKVAKLERQWSLEDAETYENDAEQKGISIVDLSEEEKNAMKSIAPKQYTRAYSNIKGSVVLVDEIQNS
jgi:TRAP-type C4-dicarboxylate transport system substrate-binding protein